MKEDKVLYTENDKILVKGIKEVADKWSNISCLWVGRINISKMSIRPNVTYIFNCNSYKDSNGIFHKNRTNTPKIFMEPQDALNSQKTFSRKKRDP